MAGMEDRRQFIVIDYLVERPGHMVAGVEILQRRVEFETLDAVILDQPPRLQRTRLALVRIDRGEGEHDVGILRRGFRDLLIGDALDAGARLHVDGEHDEADRTLAVIGDRLGDRGALVAGAEIAARRRLELGLDRVERLAATMLGMDMDVDRLELCQTHGDPSYPASARINASSATTPLPARSTSTR